MSDLRIEPRPLDEILAHPWQWWRETVALRDALREQQKAREAESPAHPGEAKTDVGPVKASAE